MTDESAPIVAHSTEPVPTTCKVCGVVFPSKLKCHSHAQTCKPQFPCGQCDAVFESKKLLAAHGKTHRLLFAISATPLLS